MDENTPAPRKIDHDALRRFLELGDEDLAITVKPHELTAITTGLQLALDAITHINVTGEALNLGENANPMQTSWAGPERWGDDPEGVLAAERETMEATLAKMDAVERRNAKARVKAMRKVTPDD